MEKNNTRRLVFRHLYDDKWGVIEKARYHWQRDKMIMPLGFQPVTGKSYDCVVQETYTGCFHYQGKDHNLCLARLADEGSVLDVVDHKFEVRKQNNFSLNPLTEALKEANLKEIALPAKHEIMVVEVEEDRKNGGLMFKPQYCISDSAADGRPSMSFFTYCGKENLVLGHRWKVRVQRKTNTRKTNKKGHIIMFVDIVLLERFDPAVGGRPTSMV